MHEGGHLAAGGARRGARLRRADPARRRRHVARLRDIDRDHLLAFDGDPSALATTPNRTRYRGLEGLVAFSEARRQLRYAEFVDHWDRLLASQFRERVEAVLV